MDWNRRIDNYCERMGPEFWAEPWNAVTNGAFIVAGVLVLLLAVKARRMDGPVLWLSILTLVIGVGSFLFHTYATVWSAIADTTPIGLFILSYFAIAMNRFAGFGWLKSLLLMVGFVVAMGAASAALRPLLFDLIGGSVSYVPAFLGLLCVGGWLMARAHPAGIWLLVVAFVFALSLTFRTLDYWIWLCDSFPIGTHFMWHILNGLMLGWMIEVYRRHRSANS